MGEEALERGCSERDVIYDVLASLTLSWHMSAECERQLAGLRDSNAVRAVMTRLCVSVVLLNVIGLVALAYTSFELHLDEGDRNSQHLVAVPRIVDFGHLRQDESSVEADVTLENRSSEDIQIDRVRTSCRCSMIDVITPFVVRARSNKTIPLRMDVSNIAGDVNHTMLFYSNDRTIPVGLHASVEAEWHPTLSTYDIDFGLFGGWEEREERVVVEHPLSLTVKSVSSDIVGISARPVIAEDRRHVYVIRAGPDLPTGPFRGTIHLDTSRGEKEVEVRGERADGMYCSERVLVLRVDKSAKTIRLFHPKGTSVRAVRVESDSIPGRVERAEYHDTHVDLDVTFDVDKLVDLPQRGQAVLVADNGDQVAVEVIVLAE